MFGRFFSLFVLLFSSTAFCSLLSSVLPGVDLFFQEEAQSLFGKKIGLIVNQTSVDSSLEPTLSKFLKQHPAITVAALFAPEHGLQGVQYAGESVQGGKLGSIPVYSLHGKTRRPTAAMLEGLDAVVYDIQCTGVRAYTYPSTLFYMMEEAAKQGIEVIVLDRPNPINGVVVDGCMLDESFRSFVGYINVPYCHGMTIGEQALFFNAEYKVGCSLRVIPMRGWKRTMSYTDTGLAWIPPSPNVPEPTTPLFCPMTGILGECEIVNIGIGYTLPFKVVGAPWIKAIPFAAALNAQKLPGVVFSPYFYRPFWGRYKGENCEGVLLHVRDPLTFRPVAAQYLIMGLLKSLYPSQFMQALNRSEARKEMFHKTNGTDAVYEILKKERFPAWKLIELQHAEREAFLVRRKPYLLYKD